MPLQERKLKPTMNFFFVATFLLLSSGFTFAQSLQNISFCHTIEASAPLSLSPGQNYYYAPVGCAASGALPVTFFWDIAVQNNNTYSVSTGFQQCNTNEQDLSNFASSSSSFDSNSAEGLLKNTPSYNWFPEYVLNCASSNSQSCVFDASNLCFFYLEPVIQYLETPTTTPTPQVMVNNIPSTSQASSVSVLSMASLIAVSVFVTTLLSI